MRHKLGFSLIELLLSLAISTILVATVLQVLIQNRHSLRQQIFATQLENQLYLAESFLRQALYSAGYAGCKRWDWLINNHAIDFHEVPELLLNTTIQGFHGPGNNDAIKISNADTTVYYLDKTLNPDANLALKNNFSAGQAILISDCHYADVFF